MLDIEDIGCLANSDHSSYLIKTLFEPVTNKTDELILDWKHANDEALQNYFNSQNWALLFHNQTVSQCWDTLVNVVNEGISEFVPRVRRRRRGRPPWLTRSALRQCRKKRRYWKAYMENRTGEHFTRFKKQEKIAKKAVQVAERYYKKKLADNMNQKPFNAYLKSKTKTKPPIGPLKTDKNTVSDNTEMSTILNNYFCSVFSIENTTNMQRAVTLDFMSPIRNVIFSRSR